MTLPELDNGNIILFFLFGRYIYPFNKLCPEIYTLSTTHISKTANMVEKFSLKWNNYLANVTKKFSSLRNVEEFSDVTLVSSDKRQVSAHKVVLSSCSDYFKTILQSNNKSKDVILCLENINQEELNNMLDYVYNGEVKIEQDQLDKFLTIAHRFQLAGLSSDESGKLYSEENHSTVVNYTNIVHPLSKTEKVENARKITQKAVKDHIKISSEEFQSVEKLDEKLKESLSRVDGTKKWQCMICNKVSADLYHAKEHVEIHFEGLSFPCLSCDKTFKTRTILRNHKNRTHNGAHTSGTGVQ